MQPVYSILANQSDITSKIKDRLLALELHDETGTHSDSLTLRLDNRPPHIRMPETGALLDVSLGYQQTALTYKGQFKVDSLELFSPPETLVIRANAADFKESFKTAKTQSFDKISLTTLTQKIAATHGYQAVVSPTLANLTFDHLDQTQESDLHLLTRLARDLNATIKPIGGKLIVMPRGESRTATGQVLKAMTLNKAQLKAYRLTMNERGRFRQVNARWYDYKTGQEREINVGVESPPYPLRRLFVDEASARLGAQAKLKAFQTGQRELNLELIGVPELFAESPIIVQGLQPDIDGSWLVHSVDHRIDGGGYSTSLSAQTEG